MARLQATPQRDHPNRSPHSVPLNGLQLHPLQDHLLQPGTEFTRIEQTRVDQRPVPQPPATPLHPHPQSGHGHSQQSPDGGVSLEGPVRGVARSPPTTPSFSRNSANVGRRRSQHGSMLLRSPARPGYSSRMKQIFEDAGMENFTPLNDVAPLYPQLPNISRLSSPKHREQRCEIVVPNIAGNRHGVILPSPEALSALPEIEQSCESPVMSEHSSGSWTDDSGYINVESRNRRSAESPKRLVLDWLTTVSATDECQKESVGSGGSDTSLERTCVNSTASMQLSRDRRPHRAFRISRKSPPNAKILRIHRTSPTDPFVIRREVDTETTYDHRSTASKDLSYSARAQRHISDTCKRLDFDQAGRSSNLKIASPKPEGSDGALTPTAKELQDVEAGGIQLSPLSPNVCVERGPSRYLSRRNSPTKAPAELTAPSCTPMKENLAIEAETMYSSRSWQTMSLANAFQTTSLKTPPRKLRYITTYGDTEMGTKSPQSTTMTRTLASAKQSAASPRPLGVMSSDKH
ncbi:hypothetical protein CC80DRAFT_591836 [Byssothecium circinans]|uniref:Uncharacterized protein n=1 Tax=Byssothecium circinans TaxID=147558 RepID=A0A6A5U203_9PLEO|nr:hypothetical protein CC80DRAFT_591836 [Byssothecium circinans]